MTTSAGNSLDLAYDFGGAGLGRAITADAGAVTVTIATTIANTGGGTAVNIRNPFLGLNWLVATQGVFPSSN